MKKFNNCIQDVTFFFCLVFCILFSNFIVFHFTILYINQQLDGMQLEIITVDRCNEKRRDKNIIFNTANGHITMRESEYKDAIKKYITIYAPNNTDEQYIDELVDNYIELMYNFNDNNFMLYYIALCSVESNFNNKVVSSAGAIGIPQVMWNIWKDVSVKNWDIDKNKYLEDLYSQLYVGYKIYEVQYKKYKGDLRKAHRAYSGGHVGYHEKVVKRYNHLVELMSRTI